MGEATDRPKRLYDAQRRCFTRCQADDYGDRDLKSCPQLRDGEPETVGALSVGYRLGNTKG